MCYDIVGTEPYMAPEIYQQCYDGKKCDVWSLGVIMITMITGYIITNDIYDEIIANDAIENELAGIIISTDIKLMIYNMLKINPKERFKINDIYETNWIKEHYNNFSNKLILFNTQINEKLHHNFNCININNIEEICVYGEDIYFLDKKKL